MSRRYNIGDREGMKEKENSPRQKQQKRPVIEIREMEIDDVATVFHMGEKIFTWEEVPNLYRTWDEYEVVNFFLSDSEFCLVAEDGDEIVGFILGTTVTKTRSAWKYGILVWLGVDPDYQEYGIATRLYRQLRERMVEDGVRILLMDTEADNEPAIAFFKKMGFGNVQEHIYMSINLDAQRTNGATKKPRRKPKKTTR